MSEKHEERRQEILAAALQAFTTKGFDKTSMDDIVRISGLSKGTLYWHFENKQALYAALVDFTMGQMITAFDSVMDATNGLGALEALKVMFEASTAMLENDPNISALTIDFMLQTLHNEQVKVQYISYFLRYVDRLAEVIQQGIDEGTFREIDPMKSAISILAVLDGLTLASMFEEDFNTNKGLNWRIGDIIAVASDLIITGLRKQE